MQFAPLLWHPNTTDDVFVFTAEIVCERKDTKGSLLKWYHWTQSQPPTKCVRRRKVVFVLIVCCCGHLFLQDSVSFYCEWERDLSSAGETLNWHDSGSDSNTSAHLALTVNTRRNMRYNKPTVILSAEIGQRRIYFSVDISRQLNSETQTC